MGGSLREADARAGWTDAVRDQAPVLHAVGYALTGSLADAEALLHAGLVALAAHWEGPDDPDDPVRLLEESCRALVVAFGRGVDDGPSPGERLVVTQPPPAGHDRDLEQRLPAWRRLHELDAGHRTVLVLRHLPAVRELDAAHVLGVRRRDLPDRERRAAAAFGPGLDDHGLDDLGPALAAVVRQLPEVVVDVDAETRLAGRARRRRAGWTAAGVLGALALVAGVGVVALTADSAAPPGPPSLDLEPLTPESGPLPLDRLPVGGPTELPYWSAGVLHMAGREFRTVAPRTILWADGTAVVIGAGRSQVVTGEAIAELPGGISSLRLAPDGRSLAWVADGEVVSAAVEDDGGLAPPETLTGIVGPDDLVRVQTVLSDGRVLVQLVERPDGDEVTGGAPGRAVAWTPGGRNVELRLPEGALLDFEPVPWPGGLSWLDPGTGIVLARVSDGGAVRPVGRLSFGGGTWDGTGEVMAQVYATVPYVLSPFDGGFAPTRLPLPPPRDRSWQVVGWESDGSVVVAVAGPGFLARTLVRCTVPALACERVGGGPDGPAVLPG